MANGLCDSYCDGCVFSQRENGAGGMRLCTYYFVTDIRRPCPAGQGCTVKQTGKKVKKWSYEHQHGWDTAHKKAAKRRVHE